MKHHYYEARDLEIIQKIKSGQSIKDIAKEMDLNPSRIYQIHKMSIDESKRELEGDWKLGWCGRSIRVFSELGLESLEEVRNWLERRGFDQVEGFGPKSIQEAVIKTGAVIPEKPKPEKHSRKWKFNPYTGSPV